MIKVKDEPVTCVTNRSVAARGFVTPDKPACVYRHYSSDGVLLYVGASVSPIARQEEHAPRVAWFRQIARIELQWFPTYLEAIDAERAAIRNENPKHNAMRYGDKPTKTTMAALRAAIKGGRPRVHGTDAERQKAYRARKRASNG